MHKRNKELNALAVQNYLMLKSFLLLLIPVLLFSCNYPGEGSLGGLASITIPVQQ
ncbi:hypothetical protein HDE68_002979 [Pedobacter cryoconitis]|uniref:Lipoprotein n=1 Tax=Pedobacter cryoconitis TaxID=188932 RepID=A0A7W8ZN38_9SPHI|nr:hypothetical protein [Pedobacter cryoconitis]MBB5637066.1 hypothetical protein [Pedobacter cryoconitis]